MNAEHSQQPGQPDAAGPTHGGADARDADELALTEEVQEAHGGSMAPGLVDATGHQTGSLPADAGSDTGQA